MTHRTCRTAKADFAYGQGVFVQIGVLTCWVINHAIGRIHRQCGIFGGAIGVRIGFRWVYFVGNIDIHRATVNPTFAVGHCVSKGSRPIVSFVWFEGHCAIRVQCDGACAVFECDHITRFYRRAINFGDGQRITIRIFVISQHVNDNWGVFFGGGAVVRHNRWVIHRCYGDINISRYRSVSIADGVVELDWTIVIGFRGEFDGTVCLQCSRTVFNRYRYANGHILTINLFDYECVSINVGVIGQYVDNNRGIFRCGGHII